MLTRIKTVWIGDDDARGSTSTPLPPDSPEKCHRATGKRFVSSLPNNAAMDKIGNGLDYVAAAQNANAAATREISHSLETNIYKIATID